MASAASGANRPQADPNIQPQVAPQPVIQVPMLPTKMKNTQGESTKDGYAYGLQNEEPTMALVEQFAMERVGPDDSGFPWYKRIQGFQAELPKDAQDVAQFTTYGKPKRFQAEMTFRVDIAVGPQDNYHVETIEFKQVIKTGVEVPFGQDDRANKDALIKALFMLEGYRHAIKEPLLERNEKRITELATKQILFIKAARDERKSGFYDRNIRWEKDPAPTTLAGKIAALYKPAPGGSITSFVIVGVGPKETFWDKLSGLWDIVAPTFLMPPLAIGLGAFYLLKKPPDAILYPEYGYKTIWNTKVHCKELEDQDTLLKDIQEAILKNDIATAEARMKALQRITTPALSASELHVLFTRNAAHALEQLDIGLKDSPLHASTTQREAISIETYSQWRTNHHERYQELEQQLTPPIDAARKADLEKERAEAKKNFANCSECIDKIFKEAEAHFLRQNAVIKTLELLRKNNPSIATEINKSIDGLKNLQTALDSTNRFNTLKAFVDADIAKWPRPQIQAPLILS
jgi:hypothetical protein